MEYKCSYINKKRIYTIYKATTPSGKVYIGYTSRKLKYRIREHLRDSEKGSKTPFHGAIRKYGNEVKFEIINIYFTEKLAIKMEEKFMDLYNSSVRQNGYNIQKGHYNSEERYYSKEYRKNSSVRHKQYWADNRKELVRKLTIANKNNTFTKEAIEKSLEVNRKKVIDSNGIIYESVVGAGRKNDKAEGTIRDYIKHGYNKDGLKFAYYNDGNFVFNIRYKNFIKCIDNNKVYSSGTQAAKDLKLKSGNAVTRVCSGTRKTYNGFKFEYIVGVF